MPEQGWKRLTAAAPWFRGAGKYPIAAYSEFMPPPRLGRKPYDRGEDQVDADVFDGADPWGWKISEYEEALELQPGLLHLAEQLLGVLRHLGRGEPAHGIARGKLQGNPFWPEGLHQRGAPPQERYVMLLPLALSRTQDDKGRVRWTLFGAQRAGPRPGVLARLLHRAAGANCPPKPGWGSFAGCWRPPMKNRRPAWPTCAAPACESTPARTMPSCRRGTRSRCPLGPAAYRWSPGQSLRGVRYLLTFCPFDRLPAAVRRAYLAGDLHLLPFPGSLLFCGAPSYLKLEKELAAGRANSAVALARAARGAVGDPHSAVGLDARAAGRAHRRRADVGPLRNTFRRTHRWARVHRHEDELAAVAANEDKLAHVLFSTAPDDLGLYGKPMARNAQIWTDDSTCSSTGPGPRRPQLKRAANRLAGGRPVRLPSSIRPCRSDATRCFGTARWSPSSRRGRPADAVG